MTKKPTFLRELLYAFQEWNNYYRRMWREWKKSIKTRRAIKLANLKSKANGGKRVYVLEDYFGNYHACLKKEVDILKRRGLMNKRATIVDLLRESIYHTR